MPFIVSDEGSGSNFAICPQGLHIGRCYSIIDLGTQKKEWNGEVSHNRQVHIAFEVYSAPPIETENGPLPQSIARFYTSSLGEKAILRFHLESWRGEQFTAEQRRKFDIERVLGLPAQLQVLHKTKANGEVTAVLSNILPIAPGTQVQDLVNPKRIFSMRDNPSQAEFDALPKGMKRIVGSSPEGAPYLAGQQQPTMVQAVQSKISVAADAAASQVDAPTLPEDDEVPF